MTDPPPRLTDEQIDSALDDIIHLQRKHTGDENSTICTICTHSECDHESAFEGAREIITQLRTELAAKNEALGKAKDAIKQSNTVLLIVRNQVFDAAKTEDKWKGVGGRLTSRMRINELTLAEIKEVCDG